MEIPMRSSYQAFFLFTMYRRYSFGTVLKKKKYCLGLYFWLYFLEELGLKEGAGWTMIMAGLLLLVQIHAPGILDDLSAIFQVKPLDDLTHVVFDGALWQEQLCPNLFIGQTLRNQGQNLNLARR